MDTTNTPVEAVNQTPSPEQAPVNEKKVGPIVAILVVVLLIATAVIYLFVNKVNEQATAPAADESVASEVQPVTNSSDEVSDLEADLNASVTGLDDQNF